MNHIHYPELMKYCHHYKEGSVSVNLIWPMLIYSYLWMTNQEIMLLLIRIKVFFSTIDGVTCASSIFQRHMETLFQGLKGVSVYIDDILISAPSVQEHLQILEVVLERLEEANFCLNRVKCFFLRPKLEYLGHVIDAQGIHPTEEKIQAIRDAPTPANVTKLRFFSGYSKLLW